MTRTILRSKLRKSLRTALVIPLALFATSSLGALTSVSNVDPDSIPSPAPLQRLLTNRLSEAQEDRTFIVQGEDLASTVLLLKFYEHRSNEPAWSDDKILIPGVSDLLNALRQSDREGLNPDDYHLLAIDRLLRQIEADPVHTPPHQFADLDLLLTDAFLTYGSHLLSGRINPYTVDNEWFLDRRTGDLHDVLETARGSGKIRETLSDLLPTHPVYKRMRDALARYRTMAKIGGWVSIAKGAAIKKGDRDPRVPLLRLRLKAEGYLNQRPNSKIFFDASLERALKHFQKTHGLDVDGVLGETTVASLNVPAEERVRQLQVNMERCRWLPADLGTRYIFVNVPDFGLKIVDANQIVMEMRVIVGRKMRRTPVFSSQMNQIVLNPSWTVPKNVAGKDILDHIHEEPDYLQKFNFEVYAGYEDDSPAVDPATVDWSTVDEKNLVYKFRQKPGPLNALGQIKFLFPNRFDVYLHDTSSRNLFDKRIRDFSSGCIRVQKPIELAEYVLGLDPAWTPEKLSKALKTGGNEQYISLKEPIPVHLMYWTAWVDEQDDVQFRDDIYGRDEPLDQALHQGVSPS